jgi:hypothetical protein
MKNDNQANQIVKTKKLKFTNLWKRWAPCSNNSKYDTSKLGFKKKTPTNLETSI